MYRRILVPLDGSVTARLGLEQAIRIATGRHVTIYLLHVVNRLSLLQGLQPVQIIADVLMDMQSRGRNLLITSKAEVEKARIEKWDGRYPQWWMAGNTAGGPNLLFQTPLPGVANK